MVNRQGSTRVDGPLRGPWVRVAGQDADPPADKTASFNKAYIKLFYFFFILFYFFSFSDSLERGALFSLYTDELRWPYAAVSTALGCRLRWPSGEEKGTER